MNHGADIIPFKPTYRRSRETDLWDLYLLALAKVQDEHPNHSTESMRRAVEAHDAWLREYARRPA